MQQQKLKIDDISGKACIITGGLLDTIHAKTAHGLVRTSRRFDILGVIDEKMKGNDAGELVDGKHRDLPVVATIAELIAIKGEKPEYAVFGMATKGGVLPQSMYPIIEEALSLGIHIVNGLHQPISKKPEFAALAEKNNVTIYDIRKPKDFEELHFWSGSITEVDCLKLGVLGTDCSMGKRTTSTLLVKALKDAGIKAEMIFTGQTGWMQGNKYGFIFDATPNDFIPGEIEHAMHSCYVNEKPDVIVVEGQASLLNPGGPCGSEFIIAGQLDGVFVQHNPKRTHYNNLENMPFLIPDVTKDIEIMKLLGTDVLAVTINSGGLNGEEVEASKKDIGSRTGLPVVSPMEDGIDGLVAVVKQRLKEGRKVMA